MAANLYIVSAPSGAGKTSLVKALLQELDNLCVSISHTTRKKRPQEQEGVDYFFVEEAIFLDMAKQGKFIEYAKVFEHYYATSHDFIDAKLKQGIDVILEIDWQGAQQVRRLKPQAQSVFILPPSIDALKQRLTKRQQDTPATITKRMQQAQSEISHYPEYDYLVINDDFAHALNELKAIIVSQRLRINLQSERCQAELMRLLTK